MTEQQYFQPGERVLLVSKLHPEYNGEYTVIQVIKRGEPYICRVTEKLVFSDSSVKEKIRYLLDEPLIGRNGGDATILQSALRKIHKPSEYSFEELINDCKTPASASR